MRHYASDGCSGIWYEKGVVGVFPIHAILSSKSCIKVLFQGTIKNQRLRCRPETLILKGFHEVPSGFEPENKGFADHKLKGAEKLPIPDLTCNTIFTNLIME